MVAAESSQTTNNPHNSHQSQLEHISFLGVIKKYKCAMHSFDQIFFFDWNIFISFCIAEFSDTYLFIHTYVCMYVEYVCVCIFVTGW